MMETVTVLSIRHVAKDQLFEKILQDSRDGRLEDERLGTRVYKNGYPKLHFPSEAFEAFRSNPNCFVYVSLVSGLQEVDPNSLDSVLHLRQYYFLYNFPPILCNKNPLPLPFTLPKYSEVQPSHGNANKEFRLVAFVQQKEEDNIAGFACSEKFQIHTKSSQFVDPESKPERKYRHGKKIHSLQSIPTIPDTIYQDIDIESISMDLTDWKTIIERTIDGIPPLQAISFLEEMIQKLNNREMNL